MFCVGKLAGGLVTGLAGELGSHLSSSRHEGMRRIAFEGNVYLASVGDKLNIRARLPSL